MSIQTRRVKNRLRVWRAERGLTQFGLAQKARVNVTRLSSIENDLIEARPEERERLARALKTTIEELFQAAAPGATDQRATA